MKNKELAQLLYTMAELYSLAGEKNRFRVAAYERAAQAVGALPESIEDAARRGSLTEIHGIGTSIEEKIREYLATGKIAALEDLKKQFPAGMLDIMSITGMGPKKARVLFDELNVETLQDLRRAATAGKIRDLKGFGKKSEENILNAIAFKERSKGRVLLFDAQRLANELIREISKEPGIRDICPAGSLRRGKETVGDIDILCTVEPGHEKAVIERFTSLPQVTTILARGETKVSVLAEFGMQVDLRILDPACYGAALLYFTGSKEHNITLRGMARDKGMTISEYGMFKLAHKDVPVAGKTEEEMYRALGMDYIPPELREERGEIEAALRHRLPKLVEEKDIRGDTHIHSRYSDGSDTIAELGEKAASLDYEWIISTDHSQSLKIARGLAVDTLRKKIREIRAFNAKSPKTKILCGVELDILADGTLDYPDEVLEELDFVIVSVHVSFKQPEKQMTERIVRALKHPLVNCLGHPTGRLIGEREPYAVNIDRVLEAARDYGKLIEINASPERLDLFDFYCKRAKELGVKLAIGTDSHALEHLHQMKLGVTVARRGWLESGDILNTLTYHQLKEYLHQSRHAAAAKR